MSAATSRRGQSALPAELRPEQVTAIVDTREPTPPTVALADGQRDLDNRRLLSRGHGGRDLPGT